MRSTTDINTRGLMALLPRSWQPYAQVMRLDRPIGWWLLVLPAYWAILTIGIIIKAPIGHSLYLIMLFTIGAIVMRGAGCVVNDLWDRDLDRSVSRTKDRAIAAGLITPMQALIFLAGLGLIGLVILLTLPLVAIWAGIASLPLIILYPLAKRVIGLPQIILALTYGWGTWLGWTAHDTPPDLLTGIMYAATAFWIFGYDTIYAIQDMKDDQEIGIKSSALTLGEYLTPVVAGCYLAFLAGMLVIGALRDAHPVYYIGLAVLAFHLRGQLRRIDRNDPYGAGVIFRSNRDAGLIITAGLLAESLIILP